MPGVPSCRCDACPLCRARARRRLCVARQRAGIALAPEERSAIYRANANVRWSCGPTVPDCERIAVYRAEVERLQTATQRQAATDEELDRRALEKWSPTWN